MTNFDVAMIFFWMFYVWDPLTFMHLDIVCELDLYIVHMEDVDHEDVGKDKEKYTEFKIPYGL